jgi:K+/H+ antiporter YhaU regulatory subunit KhtT
MQDDSPWIGHKLEELALEEQYKAGIIGIRQTNGLFIYAPPASYVMNPHEVLIVIATMGGSDELRVIAHGGNSRRPRSLRR